MIVVVGKVRTDAERRDELVRVGETMAAASRAESGCIDYRLYASTEDPDAFMRWLIEVRQRGIDAPVRIGIPGPTSIKALLKFAARCGVEASASVMSKYGISIANLLGPQL